jgi:hypothetical protein
MPSKTLLEQANVRSVLKALSTSDFRNFGLRQIAYIRPVKTKDASYYQICGADGEELISVESLELAKVLARQEDLEPVVVQ